MFSLLVRAVVALVIGILIVMLHPRTRSVSVFPRLVLGVLVGVGVLFLINAAFETFEFAAALADRSAPGAENEAPARTSDADGPGAPSTPAPEEGQERLQTREERYPTGRIKSRFQVLIDAQGNAVPHGPATTFHENGQLKWQGEHRDGRQVGKWVEFYEDGTKEGEGEIGEEGLGRETHWHPNGRKKSVGAGRGRLKHGRWTVWYDSGVKAGEYVFKENEFHGPVREWHPNGQIKVEAEYRNGRPSGRLRRWTAGGRLIEDWDHSD